MITNINSILFSKPSAKPSVPSSPTVRLIACTELPDIMCGRAAWMCTHAEPPSDEQALSALRHALASGHGSVAEHAVFTFEIEGVSRVMTHQLVRHRMASYSMRSSRRTVTDAVMLPPSVRDVMSRYDYVTEQVNRYFEDGLRLKDILRSHGVPDEDVRYLNLQGEVTFVTVTMNARELLSFLSQRCCNRAQWEIRAIADEMLRLARERAPVLFEKAGPPCCRGECKEAHPCKMPRGDVRCGQGGRF